jgi:aminoglycoside phosphotransferase family enzyme
VNAGSEIVTGICILQHIHLAPKTISIFDCIEFNDRFRYIDVASDVAFLAMDFDHHDRPDLSRQITSRMANSLRDTGMLGLMDFYKCYRAMLLTFIPRQHQDRARCVAKDLFAIATIS